MLHCADPAANPLRSGAYDATLNEHFAQQQVTYRTSGFLFGGENLVPNADGKLSLSGQPAHLIQPDEPGFDDNVPAFDCGNLSFNVTDEKASHS